MKTKNYKKQYLNPKWKELSKRIKVRDSFTCQHPYCKLKVVNNFNIELNVHHTFYWTDKRIPVWEYPDDSLITLCWFHHKVIHQINTAKDMLKYIKEYLRFKHANR
jgi:hypothetical protein